MKRKTKTLSDVEKDITEKEAELARLHCDSQRTLINFVYGPVPFKKCEDMTEEEKDQVKAWVLTDQTDKYIEDNKARFEKMGYLMAYLRELYFLRNLMQNLA